MSDQPSGDPPLVTDAAEPIRHLPGIVAPGVEHYNVLRIIGPWIEIELLGEDDSPIPNARFHLILPNGKDYEGKLNAKGFARVKTNLTGECRISFPELDQDAWERIT